MTLFEFAPLPTCSWSLRTRASALLFLTVGLGSSFSASAWAQKKDYEEWRERERKTYQEYLNEQDKAFLKFLKKKWRDVDVKAQRGSPVDDKPKEIPIIGEQETDHPSRVSGGDQQVPSQLEDPPQQTDTRPDESATDVKPKPPREASSASAPEISLRFLGTERSIPYKASLAPRLDGPVGEESIRAYWRSMAEQEYGPTLEAVQSQRTDLGLSDWGYYIYLRDLGNRLYEEEGRAGSQNAATLWTWFMMMKSGYATRVGYRDGSAFLMLPVNGQIYNRPQMHIDGQKYYLMAEDSGGRPLRTYEGQHGEASQVLSLGETTLPRLEGTIKRDTASFSYDDERFNLEYEYNTTVLDYLRGYPNVELKVLFEAGASPAAESSLSDALQPHLRNRSPREALNLLLAFVQFATKYERDRANFGEERFLFPEESLAARASDCEDRAVLFAYLARTLLGRKLIGLEWPSHVATAVRAGDGLEATSEDRTLTVDGATYVMADPTYIGSDLGMEMPFVEDKEPDMIPIARQ